MKKISESDFHRLSGQKNGHIDFPDDAIEVKSRLLLLPDGDMCVVVDSRIVIRQPLSGVYEAAKSELEWRMWRVRENGRLNGDAATVEITAFNKTLQQRCDGIAKSAHLRTVAARNYFRRGEYKSDDRFQRRIHSNKLGWKKACSKMLYRLRKRNENVDPWISWSNNCASNQRKRSRTRSPEAGFDDQDKR